MDELLSENSEIELNKKNNRRATSSQKMKYTAETQVIKQKWGDIETIRIKLGLSQRKMAQLLMVDPSAWTRWIKNEEQVPPHIYRSLSWFLTLQEKHPEAHPYFWLAGVSQPKLPEAEIKHIRRQISQELKVDLEQSLKLASRHRRLTQILYFQLGLMGLLSILVIYLIYFKVS